MTDATIERRRYFAYYLLLADSIKPMLGTCQKEVNYHWFSCDSWRLMGARHVWGRSMKCLELIADVSFARLTPSLCSLFFALPPSFSLNFSRVFPLPAPHSGYREETAEIQTIPVSFSSRNFLEVPVTQATTPSVYFLYFISYRSVNPRNTTMEINQKTVNL